MKKLFFLQINDNAILKSKRSKLEDELNTTNEKLKDLTISLEKSCKELSNSIALQGNTSAVHTRKRRGHSTVIYEVGIILCIYGTNHPQVKRVLCVTHTNHACHMQ